MIRLSSSPLTPSLTTTASRRQQNKNAHWEFPVTIDNTPPQILVVDLRRRNADARGRGFPLPCLCGGLRRGAHERVLRAGLQSGLQQQGPRRDRDGPCERIGHQQGLCLPCGLRPPTKRSSRSMPRPASSSNPRSLSILRAMARSPSRATPARSWTSLPGRDRRLPRHSQSQKRPSSSQDRPQLHDWQQDPLHRARCAFGLAALS